MDSFCQSRLGTCYSGCFSLVSAGWDTGRSLSQNWGSSCKYYFLRHVDFGIWMGPVRQLLWYHKLLHMSASFSNNLWRTTKCFFLNKKVINGHDEDIPSTVFLRFHSFLRFPAIPYSWKNLVPVKVAARYFRLIQVSSNFTRTSGLRMSSSNWKTERLKVRTMSWDATS